MILSRNSSRFSWIEAITGPIGTPRSTSTAVPETLESSLQLSEAVLVDLGVPMGPVIASIHEKRDELRERIREGGELDHKPKLRTSVAET